MPRTLFERLRTPERRADRPVAAGEGGARAREVASVLRNLERVLTSRLDHAAACPDYGLLDLPQLHHELAHAAEAVERTVQRCIERFEPRLSRVRVKRVEDPGQPFMLCFSVAALLFVEGQRREIGIETIVDECGRVRLSAR